MPATAKPIAAGLLTGVALIGCGPGPLAEAGEHQFTVDDAARLISEHSTVPADTQVVRVVAELWVDYTLLAAHLGADTTLATLDVGLVVEQPLQELMLAQLRDAVIDVDTVVSDEELAERFAAELPGAQATASQILLLFPPGGGTSRQRDSVLVVATSLRDQLLRGGDFATLASRYSGDPGSGSRGGSMGTFGRGQMLAPIDEAVFALQPGQLSEPVETPLGYHVLRLDALSIPELSEVGEEFRALIQQERLGVAEAAYIAELDTLAGLTLAEGALQITRALMESSPSRLSSRAAARPLMTWADGVYTVGEFMELARVSPDGFAEGVLAASDEELEVALRRRGRQELLLAEAETRGFAATRIQADSLAAAARAAIRERAEVIGLVPREPAQDSTLDAGAPAAVPSVQQVVDQALARVIGGQQEIVPLGGVTFLLREEGRWRIHEARLAATVTRARELESR